MSNETQILSLRNPDWSYKSAQEINNLLDEALSSNRPVEFGGADSNPHINAAMLDKMLALPYNRETDCKIAAHPKASLKAQQAMFDKHFGKYYYSSPIFALLRNPKLKPQLFVKFAEENNKEVLDGLSVHPHFPLVVNRLFERMYVEKTLPKHMGIVPAVAANYNLKPEYIKFFFNNTNETLFKNVGEELNNFSYHIKNALAENPSLTGEQVTNIVHTFIKPGSTKQQTFDIIKKKHFMLENLAENGNCTPEIFEQLALYGTHEIHESLVKNPRTPTFALRIIADNNRNRTPVHASTLLALIKHRNVTNEMLQEIADNKITKKVAQLVVKEMFSRGMFGDWPLEWVEAHHGIKIDAKWLPKGYKK